MYQPHLKVSWGPYQGAPPPPQGFFLGPPKVYSLCSPMGNKHPATLIPATLMAVHPGGQHRPFIGLSQIVRAPPPPMVRGPPPRSVSPHGNQPVVQNRTASPRLPSRGHLQQTTENLQGPSINSNSDKRTCSPIVVRISSPDNTDNGNTMSAGRKRAASPEDSERKMKRQREISLSPDLNDNPPRTIPDPSLVTPEKIMPQPTRYLSESDIRLGRKLTSCIEALFKDYSQKDEWLKKKMRLRDALHSALSYIYPHSGLYMVGSSMTGMATQDSDLDLCLVLGPSEIDQQTEATRYLREILQCFNRNCEYIHKAQLISAKVPILKFTDRISGVEVDLNVNNTVGIRNTQLINSYSRLDSRVPPLCLLVKFWAKVQDINDPFNKTLSSYSLILMVLHFLQVGCEPPVLPCLHDLMPNHFSNFSDIRNLILNLDLPVFNCANKQSLGELLLGFFHYYGHDFNFQDEVISVRTGGTLPKSKAMNCRSPKNRPAQWNYICIEEPFDRTNTARSVFDKKAFNRILNAFSDSLEQLRQTQDLDSVLR